MKIVHITPYYVPAFAFGGVTRAVEGLARAQAKLGHDVTVLTTDALSQTSRYKGPSDTWLDGVHILRAQNVSVWLRGKLNFSTPLRIAHIGADALKCADIVHLHEFRTIENLMINHQLHEKQVVLSPHGTLTQVTGRSQLKRIWDRLISPTVARSVNHVICLTEQEATDVNTLWAHWNTAIKTSVIPNGVWAEEFTPTPDTTAFRARWGLGEARVALFLGRLHARKGVEVLLRAFLKANIPDARLLIVGPDEGMLNTLKAQADERVIFTGYLDATERLQAIFASSVFALPAVGEGLSMSALEALAGGLPVILSPGCHLPEVAEAGAGLIVDVDEDAIAQALTDILTHPDQMQKMGQAGRDLIAKRFTWPQVAQQCISVYEDLLTQKGVATYAI